MRTLDIQPDRVHKHHAPTRSRASERRAPLPSIRRGTSRRSPLTGSEAVAESSRWNAASSMSSMCSMPSETRSLERPGQYTRLACEKIQQVEPARLTVRRVEVDERGRRPPSSFVVARPHRLQSSASRRQWATLRRHASPAISARCRNVRATWARPPSRTAPSFAGCRPLGAFPAGRDPAGFRRPVVRYSRRASL